MSSTQSDPSRKLDRYRRNITSQCGEDGVIEYLLTLLPATPKTCLEVGAGDGINLSNTHTLWFKHGWRALLVESVPLGVRLIKERAAGRPDVTAVEALITAKGANSLDDIAERVGFPRELGVLSLDIDSNDLEVLENLNYLTPHIVVIEFNHEIPPEIDYRDRPGDIFFRHSAKAVETSAKAHGYRVVACTGPNAILVREALLKGEVSAALPTAPIEQMFDYDFLRTRKVRHRVVQSKFITEELAVQGEPDFMLALRVRLSVWGRKLRRLLRGRPAGERITPERRAHLRSAGLWI